MSWTETALLAVGIVCVTFAGLALYGRHLENNPDKSQIGQRLAGEYSKTVETVTREAFNRGLETERAAWNAWLDAQPPDEDEEPDTEELDTDTPREDTDEEPDTPDEEPPDEDTDTDEDGDEELDTDEDEDTSWIDLIR